MKRQLIAVALALLCGCSKPPPMKYFVTFQNGDGDELKLESRGEPKLKDGVYSFTATNGASYQVPANSSRVMSYPDRRILTK